MSEPIKLNSGGVATLGDTDRVVGCDSNGAIRSISMANLLAQIRSSIQIGGRNLIPGSAKFTGWTAKQGGYVPDGNDGMLSVRKSTGAYYGAYRMMSFVAGATYTFSVYTDSPDSLSLFIKYVNDLYGSQTANFGAVKRASRQISQNWYQVSATAKCTTSGTALIEVESGNIPATQTVRYCAPKLEIGNVPTDWSPAPEDLSGGGNSQSFNWLQIKALRRAERRAA